MIGLMLSMVALSAEPTYADQAYAMLQKHNVAMISTIVTEDGVSKPYGSVMPYALVEKECCKTNAGSPYVFISDLALHTDNINANPNVSVMVFEPDKKGNVFNGARVTLSGKLVKVEDEGSVEKLKKTYLAKNPDAKEFIDFGDFNFYMLKIEKIYFIGGFGEIGYVKVEDYRKVAK